MSKGAYVLVSACRNEDAYIEGLIECVAAQKLRPIRWVIVDDSSTDDTYARASAHHQRLPFLDIIKAPQSNSRSFASQVYAAQFGYEFLKGIPFDYIGFLDADIRFSDDYYEKVIYEFDTDISLGLVGGTVVDKYPDRVERSRQGSEDYHVAGGVQMFRRQCFEQMGAYTPIEGGGQDTIADVTAMMNGWRVRAFPSIEALHLRPDGFTQDSVFLRGMKWGRKFYSLGYHPLFYFGQCMRKVGHRPFIIGSLCQLLGFAVATVKRQPRAIPADIVRYIRKLQMQRIRHTYFHTRSRESAKGALIK